LFLSGYRVIIIDPDPTTTKYLAFELKKAGLTVFATNNIKEGLILAYQHRPHVIILEPNIPDLSLEEILDKLKKDRRTARTRVIAFSSLTAPEEIQAVVDLGFYHYMAKEGASVPALIEQVQQAAQKARGVVTQPAAAPATVEVEEEIDEPEPVKPTPSGSGKLIVFLSAKGGIGTSSICANLAHVFNSVNETDVAVVDLVLPIGSIASIVGYDGDLDIIKVAANRGAAATIEFLRDSLPKPDNWNFRLLAGSSSPKDAGQLEVTAIPVIINNLRKIYEYVFIDLGKSLSRISLPLITSASQVVLMISLDQTSAAQTKSVLDYLLDQGVAQDKIYLLINRAVDLEGLNKSEVEKLLGARIPLALPHMGRDFSLANNLNQPVSMKFPQDAVTFSLVQAAEEIIVKMD
jgi:MinD-like ATPase involved in chromosome partitioning or flagellar assembly/DNA-binding NarL/FixJ family response regulator